MSQRVALLLILTCASTAVAEQRPEAPAAPPSGYFPAPAYPRPGYPPPQPGYTFNPSLAPLVDQKPRPQWALIGAGLGLWFLSWSTDWISTLALDHSPGYEAFIPVAGPFVQMGDSYESDFVGSVSRGMLAVDGLIQIGGVVMTIVGAAVWTKPKSPVRMTASGVAVTF